MKSFIILISLVVFSDSKSQDIEFDGVSEKLHAISEAGKLYEQYDTYNDFFNSELPGSDLKTKDALLKYSGYIDYSANEARIQYDDILQDDLDLFERAYDQGSYDATGAGLLNDSLNTVGTCVVTGAVSKSAGAGCLVGFASMFVSTVNSSNLVNDTMKPRAVEKFRKEFEKKHRKEIDYAINKAKNDSTGYWNSINNYIDEPKSGEPSGKKRLARDLQKPGLNNSDILAIEKNIAKNRYGETDDSKKQASKLLIKAKAFINSNEKVAVEVGKAAQLFQALGGKIPKDVAKGIEIYGGLSSAATKLASQDYLGAALSVVGLFKKKGPDPAQLRFKAIMSALGKIDKKLDRILTNQQKIISNQYKILSSLRRLETGMSAGFENIYNTLQRRTDQILIAIYEDTDRELTSCKKFSYYSKAYIAPDPHYIKSRFDLNRFGYSGRKYNNLKNLNSKERVNSLFKEYIDDFNKCNVTLNNLLFGIRDHDQVNPYLILNTFKISDSSTRKNRTMAESYTDFADQFVQNIYLKQLDYYRSSYNQWLSDNEQTNNQINGMDFSDLYLFHSPLKLVKSNNLTRFSKYRDVDIEKLGYKYKSRLLHNLISMPVSATVLKTIAEPIRDIHQYYGLVGDNYIGFDALGKVEIDTKADEGLSLLSHAHQLVELSLAQHSIADGRALLPFLFYDSLSINKNAHIAVIEQIERNSQLKVNFLRYMIHQMLLNKSRSLREYALTIDTGNTNVIKKWFYDLSNDMFNGETSPLKFDIRCVNDTNEVSECPEGGNRYFSDIQVKIILELPDSKNETKWFDLPGWQDILDERLEVDKVVYDLLVLQRSMGDEIATYNFNSVLDKSLKNNNQESLHEPMRRLYQLSLINDLGIDTEYFTKDN